MTRGTAGSVGAEFDEVAGGIADVDAATVASRPEEVSGPHDDVEAAGGGELVEVDAVDDERNVVHVLARALAGKDIDKRGRTHAERDEEHFFAAPLVEALRLEAEFVAVPGDEWFDLLERHREDVVVDAGDLERRHRSDLQAVGDEPGGRRESFGGGRARLRRGDGGDDPARSRGAAIAFADRGAPLPDATPGRGVAAPRPRTGGQQDC